MLLGPLEEGDGSAVEWLRERDPGFGALRRAARAALVMPAMFAWATRDRQPGGRDVRGLRLVRDAPPGRFRGPMRARLQAQAALAVTGRGCSCRSARWPRGRPPSPRCSDHASWAFGVMFAGVVSSVLAGATTSLLLAFILPVSLPGPNLLDSLYRLAGWGMASAAALLAIWLLWPAPARDPVRSAATRGTRAVAAPPAGRRWPTSSAAKARRSRAERDAAIAQGRQRGRGIAHRLFFATPYRPTGLSTRGPDRGAAGGRAQMAQGV